MPKNRHQLRNVADVLRYIRGGKGKFTIINPATGKHFTYRLGVPKFPKKGRDTPIFVKAAEGFIGCIWPEKGFVHYSRTAKLSENAVEVKAIKWFVSHLFADVSPFDKVEFWHEGTCGVCGRGLTVPTSIQRGIGPVCVDKIRF